jgi:hypothetical protein
MAAFTIPGQTNPQILIMLQGGQLTTLGAGKKRMIAGLKSIHAIAEILSPVGSRAIPWGKHK